MLSHIGKLLEIRRFITIMREIILCGVQTRLEVSYRHCVQGDVAHPDSPPNAMKMHLCTERYEKRKQFLLAKFKQERYEIKQKYATLILELDKSRCEMRILNLSHREMRFLHQGRIDVGKRGVSWYFVVWVGCWASSFMVGWGCSFPQPLGSCVGCSVPALSRFPALAVHFLCLTIKFTQITLAFYACDVERTGDLLYQSFWTANDDFPRVWTARILAGIFYPARRSLLASRTASIPAEISGQQREICLQEFGQQGEAEGNSGQHVISFGTSKNWVLYAGQQSRNVPKLIFGIETFPSLTPSAPTSSSLGRHPSSLPLAHGHHSPPLPSPRPATHPLLAALPLHLSSPGKPCMGDPDVDHEFLYDEQGRVDILQSPFFDVTFGSDRTNDEYVDRIIYQLTLAIEDRIPQGRWYLIGRPSTPPNLAPNPATTTRGILLSTTVGHKL
ncbi:hypothetical protein M5K25_008627 [Dendrobium thyrsiflorum]|uniref:Uncharacterized protein n=1 Tax=Dendrobium thyrsiflorum TaxID=117978 RepID=A0ABD0V8K9_DENTH